MMGDRLGLVLIIVLIIAGIVGLFFALAAVGAGIAVLAERYSPGFFWVTFGGGGVLGVIAFVLFSPVISPILGIIAFALLLVGFAGVFLN